MKNVSSNLSNFKSEVDKLDVDKLVAVPVDLSKISNVVKNNVVKKDVYIVKIKNIEDKTPVITNLATNTTLNVKISEVKNEMPSITNLSTATALTPDHIKYITNPEIHKLTAWNLAARLAQTNFTRKNDIANFVKKADFDNKLKQWNNKVISNKTKDVLVENELSELPKNVETISTKGST